MKKPLIIGITGGIGGGKSTFSNYLRKRGELVYDTDIEAKKLQDTDEQIITELKELFGDDIYTKKGLDRGTIAKIVFSDKEKLNRLNQIIHPKVKSDFKEWVNKHPEKEFLFMECAILFEGGFDEFVDKIAVITAPEDVRIKRVIKRDGLTEAQVKERIKNQISDNEKIKKADWVIDTNNRGKSSKCASDFLLMLKKNNFENI